MVHPTIESLLRCPRCRGSLDAELDDEALVTGYACRACRVRYPVRDGLADFTPDAAEPVGIGAP